MTITASTTLTTVRGTLTVHYHEGPDGACVSFVAGNPADATPLLVRLHSACLFGEAIGDQTCDCGPQLAAALTQISMEGRGVLVYLFQEGRGIGLKDKIRAMELQQREGLDTVAAMQRLGYGGDLRTYTIAAAALRDLQAPTALRLMSNNPAKRRALEDNGFEIVETVSLSYTLSSQAHTNLLSKDVLFGHAVDFSRLVVSDANDQRNPVHTHGRKDARSVSEEAVKLADYIKGLRDFTYTKRDQLYNHMGATITDAILQAGMRYDVQVRPRVQRILAQYPDATTSRAFQHVLGTDMPHVVVNMNGRKALWVQQATDFFVAQHIETEQDLATWLLEPESEQRLLQLKGVGLKTVNYFKLLVGMRESVAVDTHIRAFLAAAGIPPTDDRTAGAIVAAAAALLPLSPAQLDASIWNYRTRRRLKIRAR